MAETKDKVQSKDKGIKLQVELIHEDSKLPVKPTTNTDSGFDVFAYDVKRVYYHGGGNGEALLEGEALERKFVEPGTIELQCNERALIGTGIKATVGPGYEIQVRPRSGLALKKGLTVVNTPGTVDESYRGEIGIIILNTSRQTQQIVLGESIAQIVPAKVELLDIEEVKLEDTVRSAGGFGHSDEKKDDDNKALFEGPSL